MTDKPERRCSWPACQAGGVILPGAPFVTSTAVGLNAIFFHPGCAKAAGRPS